MANKTVYPFGTDGQLPSSIGIINDLTTGGVDKALSAEMGKMLNDRFIVEKDARYVFPEMFGQYKIENGGLTQTNTHWCTKPFLLKNGETVKTTGLASSIFGVVESDTITASTTVTMVAKTPSGWHYLSYTNNTGSDVYVIWCHNCRDTALLHFWGLSITDANSETTTLNEIKGEVGTLENLFSDNENLLPVDDFRRGTLKVYESAAVIDLYYNDSGEKYRVSKPIQLHAGDKVHIKYSTGANLKFGRMTDDATQTTSTRYTGMWSNLSAFENNVAEFTVSEDMLMVFSYMEGDLLEAYIEHPTASMLTHREIHSVISDDCIVENGDSDLCLIMGSSLTYNHYSPKTLSWIERLNDLVDIGIVNGGHSGASLSGNITDMTTGPLILPNVSLKKLAPRYIVSNNDANGTPTGKNLDTQLKQFERISNSIGATCLVAGEEPTLIDMRKYDKQAAMTKRGINYFPSAKLWYYMNSRQGYRGWLDGSQRVHSNFKNGSSHIIMREMLDELYIHKSVKFYKVRENYKGGSPTTAQLAYSNNNERAAIWRGTCPAISRDMEVYNNDNIDNYDYGISETPGVDLMTDTTVSCEVANSKFGSNITFYKHALVEIITPRVQVTNARVTVECSAEPTAVGYIANGSYVSLTTTYDSTNGILTIPLFSPDIQDYDKIKLVISDTTDDTFTLGKVKAVLYDGHAKPSFEVRYTGRKEGKELMAATSVATGWTFSGNASVEQLPTAVRLYTRRNDEYSHIQLDDDNATASYTQSIDHTVHKVAVRIAATIFPPLGTTRTSNAYTTTTQNIFHGMYYGGELLLTINDAYIPLHIETGWTEVYAEAIIDSNSLSITLGRATTFDSDNYNVGEFPVFIHNVSVQEID